MESADTIAFQSAIKFISGEYANVCRICFAANFHDVVYIQDTIKVARPHMEENLTISEMLGLLGIPEEKSMPQSMCTECAAATITSYIFHTNCQYANDKWRKTIHSLENCLSESDAIGPTIKTAYFVINGKQNSTVTSRKKIRKDKTVAVKTLKQLLDRLEHYEQYICAVCANKFSSKSNLNYHMKRHKKDGQHQDKITCPQCLRQFSTKIQLQDHSERVHFPKTVECPQCKQMFGSLRILMKHTKLHHEPVTCKLCSLQYPSRRELHVHLADHQDNKCSDCKKKFKSKTVYKLHLKTCGNKKERNPDYFCDICGKAYQRKNSLRSHLITSHGFGKTYDCSWCEKKFDAQSTLKNHIVTHTKEKKYYCEVCGGKFVTQPALTYHMRLHTGEKPYQCDQCTECFLSASRRAEHKQRKHIGPQLGCCVCQAKFVTKHQLNKHERRHYDPQSKLYEPFLNGI